MKKAKLLVAVASVLSLSGVFAINNVKADTKETAKPATESIYDVTKADSYVLKAASQFHLFVKGDSTLSSHVDGNMAVGGVLNANGNFGTKAPESTVPTDYYYLNKVQGIQSSSFVAGRKTNLILKNSDQYEVQNQNGIKTPYLNSTKLDHISADDVYTNPNFIDFDKEFAYLEGLQSQIATNTENKVGNVDTIDLSKYTPDANGAIVLTIAKEYLQDSRQLNIVNHAAGTTVYINVDGGGTPLNLSKHIRIDGKGNSERTDYSDSFLLWNIYNTSSIKMSTEWLGSVLAPDASVISSANIDGTIIADSVRLSGETHRWDFQGKNPPIDPNDQLVVKNYKKKPETYYGDKVIKKIDGDTNKALAGVEFTLYDESGKKLDTKTTDDSGLAKFTHLKEGKYYVVETKALDGYEQDTTKHFFIIAQP